mmetsp:Transcript_128377/g.357359  ORF Transcript_128377/g.357359 Transcript_128377/m.357359 type:complete len:236 (+) Transcript_128377:953-1660(+)
MCMIFECTEWLGCPADFVWKGLQATQLQSLGVTPPMLETPSSDPKAARLRDSRSVKLWPHFLGSKRSPTPKPNREPPLLLGCCEVLEVSISGSECNEELDLGDRALATGAPGLDGTHDGGARPSFTGLVARWEDGSNCGEDWEPSFPNLAGAGCRRCIKASVSEPPLPSSGKDGSPCWVCWRVSTQLIRAGAFVPSFGIGATFGPALLDGLLEVCACGSTTSEDAASVGSGASPR